eukprot:TRINITY_DN1011_c1_g4_i1.p1 TRINITY_DN1011_c1_g4~~TRINITY_DN1011_c1_g4_i1.p1  ORF type:complete len:519 (+),score=128.63 TRINITY_DN1011_c1_g4_i1:519-2075(+)
MSSEYTKLPLKRFPKTAGRANTPESRFWKSFRFPVLAQHYAAVTHINFCPAAPHHFAVSSSTRVTVYGSASNKPFKTITRFKDVAYSGAFRADGKLICSGGAESIVKVFDYNSRAILRQFKGHEGPIHHTAFAPNNTQIMSTSDDGTVRQWDMPTGEQTGCYEGHEDYVRCGTISPSTPDMWVSGGYDHKVMLWDTRTGACSMEMDHGSPVQSVITLPGGGLVLSAGGNTVKVWDVLGGGRLLETLNNHQKAVTGVMYDKCSSRLFTCSLDHHVKVYDVADYQVTHSMKYSGPILCMGISPDNKHFAVGMADGMLSIKTRQVDKAEKQQEEQKKAQQQQHRAGTYKYFMRGKRHQANLTDQTTEWERKQRLQEYDVYLRKFQYRNALDAALNTRSATVVISLLEELANRGGLRIALSGRDEVTLSPILSFLVDYITNPRHSELLVEVGECVLDLYASIAGRSPITDELFNKLKQQLNLEVTFQKQCFALLGSMELLLGAAASTEEEEEEEEDDSEEEE